MKSKIYKVLLPATLVAIMATGCSDDQYTSRGDLFQPRFATNPAVTVKNNNDMALIWYAVNDAKSYTVQLFEDYYYQNLFMELETEDPYVVIEDLPYAKRFYVRVKTNAHEEVHSSLWALTDFTTEVRPDYAQIVQGVSKTEINDNDAMVRWVVDIANPVDSFSVVPKLNPELPTITGYIPAESRTSGEMKVEGLSPSTLYSVNLYDTSKPRRYDKPYNEVTFRTTGPVAKVVQIGITDDLSAILLANNDDPDIPEGTRYELEAGTTYNVQTFPIKKGFTIACPNEGQRPIIVLSGTWNIFKDAYLSVLGFENVEFRNALAQQYFMNSGNPFTIENVSFTNCVFRNIYRGFWRHQASNKKHIEAIEIENCWFDQCGWQSGCYGTFAFGSAGNGEIGTYDQIDALTIRNTTFSRGGYKQDVSWGWGNLMNHSTSSCPINLTVENVTFYDFCVNQRLIDITNTEKSNVTIRNVVVASPMGELIATGSGTRTSYSNNYVTSDYKMGGSKIKATELPIAAVDIFKDPDNGDYTVKDKNSLIYITQAGDLRWIK